MARMVSIVSAQSSRGGSNSGNRPRNRHLPDSSVRATPSVRYPFRGILVDECGDRLHVPRRLGAQRSTITCGAPLATLKRAAAMLDLRLGPLRHRIEGVERLDERSCRDSGGRAGEDRGIDRIGRVAPRRQPRRQQQVVARDALRAGCGVAERQFVLGQACRSCRCTACPCRPSPRSRRGARRWP